MWFLRFHIINDEKLNRRIDEARQEQRQLETTITSKLLASSERFRKIAESALRRPIGLPTGIMPKLAERMRQNRSKQEEKI